MRLGNMSYLIKQGLKNTWNNRLMTFASIGVLISCLLLIGSSAILSLNINKIASDIERQNEIVAFLNDDISEDQISDISAFLSTNKSIETFDYISKEEALEKHMSTMDNGTILFESLKDDNPLPASFNIVLSDLSTIDKCISQIKTLDGVDKINAPIEMVKMIISIKHSINITGITIVAILLFVSLIIISNTVKLTIYNRRKEINIMKFVGATDFFIKLPFIVEGLFIGFVSALLSHFTLWFGYNYLISLINNTNLQWVINLHNSIIPFNQYNIYFLSGFLSIGIFIGLMGSSFFVKKYLKV